MKAISIWQPWATAIVLGAKRVETRSKPTHYRGPIAIHASARKQKGELLVHQCSWHWNGVLHPVFTGMGGRLDLEDVLTFGAVIGFGRLCHCKPTHEFTLGEVDAIRQPAGDYDLTRAWTERQLGDFSLGRYGWVIEYVEMFKNPIPFKGKQGFFEVPDSLLAEVHQ